MNRRFLVIILVLAAAVAIAGGGGVASQTPLRTTRCVSRTGTGFPIQFLPEEETNSAEILRNVISS
jgi:hypothetical protein